MKTNYRLHRFFAFILCAVLMLGVFPSSVFAAKEMFTTYQISSVAINGIDAPEAGKYFDFTAEENSQKYNILKVVWQKQYSDKFITDTSSVVSPGTVYSVCIILEVASPDHYFMTGEGRVSAVPSVTVNGQTARADNVQDYELFSIDASKYEHDTVYQRFLRVWYTFPEVPESDLMESLDITIDPPRAGELPPKKAVITRVNGEENVGFVNVDSMDWSYQSGKMLGTNTPFEYGENYTVTLSLTAVRSKKFATDPKHFLASPGNPFTAVKATVNGKTATVLPNGDASAHIVVSVVLPCEGVGKITEASVSVTPPKSGESPNYKAVADGNRYTVANTTDRFTSGGVTWYNETERKSMYVGIDKFAGGNTYTVTVELTAAEGYEFSSYAIPAKINGNNAEIWGRAGSEAYLSYTFEALPEEKHICTPVKADEVKATCTADGKEAHYFCRECGKFFEDQKCTKEITDINRWGVIPAAGHKGGKATCKEQAKCTVCGLAYGEFAPHNYGSAWDYKDAKGHAHTCKVCGVHDTIQPHTGGAADCGKIAKCEECKAEYGEVKAHQWSASWEYTDNKGHAKKCTACGEHDEVLAHTGGTADCKNKAKCSACGTEYGKTGEHKWSSGWEYQTSSGHAHTCTVNGCDAHSDVVKHTPGEAATATSPQVCTDCNYVIEAAKQHTHKMTRVEEVDATCTTAGRKAYYTCSDCGFMSSDQKGNNPITDESSLIIPQTGHKESKWKSDGESHWKECTVKGCGVVIEGTKAAHEFGKNKKCTVCDYRNKTNEKETTLEETDEPVIPAETVIPEETDEPDTIAPEETTETEAPLESEAPETKPEVDGDTPSPTSSDNMLMWIITAAAVGFAAVCMIVMTVVLVKTRKK